MDAELLDTGCLSLLKKAGSVVVGLSGGRDSVALLHLLHEAGLQVVVCHVHHGIRGADADADAAFCRMVADALGVDFVEKRADVPRYAGNEGFRWRRRRVRRATRPSGNVRRPAVRLMWL